MTMGVWPPAGELARWRLLAQMRQERAAERRARSRAAQPLRACPLRWELVERAWIAAARDQQQVLACCQRLPPQTTPRAQAAYSTKTNTIPQSPAREPRVPT